MESSTRDIRRAVDLAGASAPGPDGIPYAAWKRLGPLAVDSLWGALKVLESDGGLEALAAASPPDADGGSDWNRALMVCTPKKLPQSLGSITYREPGHIRPLSIVNTDNRFLAYAVRLRV